MQKQPGNSCSSVEFHDPYVEMWYFSLWTWHKTGLRTGILGSKFGIFCARTMMKISAPTLTDSHVFITNVFKLKTDIFIWKLIKKFLRNTSRFLFKCYVKTTMSKWSSHHDGGSFPQKIFQSLSFLLRVFRKHLIARSR